MLSFPTTADQLPLLIIMLVWPVFAAGCDFGVIYVDPEVEYEVGSLVIEGEPEVELGLYDEQLYLALTPGDDAPIVHGLQGGNWTHPAVRTKGINTPATIDCTLTLEDGEQVGLSKALSNFFLSGDGVLEVQSFPIAVLHTDPSKDPAIDDLYDQAAELRCSVADADGRAAESRLAVTLTEG